MLTDEDDTVESYDTKGILKSITYRGGYTQTIARNSNGQIASVTDSFGRTLTFSYNPDNNKQLVSVTLPDGGAVGYRYDQAGRLAKVTYPDLSFEQYQYADANHPYALTGIIDELSQQYASIKYDPASGYAIASALGGFASAGGLGAEAASIDYSDPKNPQVTDALGVTRTYHFIKINGRQKLASISGPPCNTCNAAQIQSYDSAGYFRSLTDWNGNITTYVYDDARGLELLRTEAANDTSSDPGTRTITTQWEPNFRLPHLISEYSGGSANGKPTGTLLLTIELDHDAAGHLTKKTITDTKSGASRTWTYSNFTSWGAPRTIDGPRTDVNDTTSLTYDTHGNLTSITNALGQTMQITRYDANGYPLTMTDANGVETDLAYDARQRLTSRTIDGDTTRFDYDPAGELIQVTLPTGAYLHYSYDAAHRLTGISDSLGNRIQYTLDALGNHIREDTLDPSGTLTRTLRHVYDNLNHLTETVGGAGQTTQYVDDPLGNPTSIIDPLQHVTAQTFDPLNRLAGIADPLNGRTTFAYDSQDRPTDVIDPRGLTTHYVYDAFGDLVEKDSPDTGTTTYTYDAAGNRLSQTDARGITATYTYDALNRLIGIQYPDSSEDVTYTYDQGTYGIGHLTGIMDESGTTNFQYDARGNVVQKTVTVDGHSFTVAYRYDAANELAGITYPDGLQVAYQRDIAGRITGVTATRNGITRTVASNIGYEPFGPVTSITYGNGLTETRQYDLAYRLTALNVPGILDWTLGHDPDNNITAITDVLNSANSQSFGYDALNRLTSATGTYGALGYAYDADGNRTSASRDDTPTAYGYDSASNRLLSVGNHSYQYDASGNLISDSVHTYAYNDADRLSGYDAHPNAYLYNGLGQRVRKPFPVKPGDANGDGIIDQNDLHGLQDALRGKAPVSAGMDCNQDGQVNNKDKSCIARQIGKGKGRKKDSGTNSRQTYSAAAATTNSLYLYFVYDESGHLLGEYDDNGNLIREHIWLGERPIAVSTPTGLDYVTADQLGTPRAITNQTQQLVWQWQSDPFGNGKPSVDPSGLGLFVYNLRFPGQYFDAETGHDYNYFRDYAPIIGRYTESDPMGLLAGVNSFLYVKARPLALIDLLGLTSGCGQNTTQQEVANAASTFASEAEVLEQAGVFDKLTPALFRELLSLIGRSTSTADLFVQISIGANGVMKLTLEDAVQDIRFYKRDHRISPTGRQYYDSIVNWGKVNWADFNPGMNQSPLQVLRNLGKGISTLPEYGP